MTILQELEEIIYYTEGVRVSLSGTAPIVNEYWKTRFKGEGTVAEFRTRFAKRFPRVEIVLYTGVGLPAHGNYLLKNLRATYEFAWIKAEYADMITLCNDIVRDQERKIRALKKALRASVKAAEVEKDPFDPYAELGVKPDASDDDIKLAYKKRIHVFHPDKFATMDALVIEFATEKAQQINRAREDIARQRAEAKAA